MRPLVLTWAHASMASSHVAPDVIGSRAALGFLALALAIKLTEVKDGSRAMVTAAAATSMLLLFR